MFKKEEKSSFAYWFAHWCSYNMTALVLRAWKFKYLFHDIEKPFIRLLLPYEKVRKVHRKNNKHHPEWLEYRISDKTSPRKLEKLLKRYDFEGTIIDWECSRYTKEDGMLNAYENFKKVEKLILDGEKYPNITKRCAGRFIDLLIVALRKLNLDPTWNT